MFVNNKKERKKKEKSHFFTPVYMRVCPTVKDGEVCGPYHPGCCFEGG